MTLVRSGMSVASACCGYCSHLSFTLRSTALRKNLFPKFVCNFRFVPHPMVKVLLFGLSGPHPRLCMCELRMQSKSVAWPLWALALLPSPAPRVRYATFFCGPNPLSYTHVQNQLKKIKIKIEMKKQKLKMKNENTT